MIEFKGVREPLRVLYMEPELVKVINLASVWSARHGVHVRITSLNDHKHKSSSLHYEKLFKEGMADLAKFFRQNLELGWDVVWDSPGHYNHIHCEWDIRQRDTPRGAE